MGTTTQLTTAEELFRLPEDGLRYELVKGELRRMSPGGYQHGKVIIKLSTPLNQYVEANALGSVCGAETGFKLASNPDTVRAPDIAFVSRKRIDQTGEPEGYYPGAPDLAVEIQSPSQSSKEMEDKAREWLAAGARAVWVIDPKRRAATIYHSSLGITALTDQDALDGQDVVPGFDCPLARIFA